MDSGKKRWWKRLILFVVLAGLAVRAAWWGRPLPVSISAKRMPAAPNVWEIYDGAAANPLRATDQDGDGVWDEFVNAEGLSFFRPGYKRPPKRWLVICIDGVPLEVMQKLWERGHFREFFRPTAVVSTYPSDSETALTAVLHGQPVPGYEHLYFDRAKNSIRGGWWVTLSGYRIPYIKTLDYDTPGWAKALPYLVGWKSYRADLGRMRNAYGKAPRSPIYLAHIAVSDAMFHLFSARELEPGLIEFENLVHELYLDSRGELGVLLFSDHGNTQVPSKNAPLEEHLQQRGWNVRSSLEGPRDVAVPDYGLVGFAAVYCRPEAVASLAEDIRLLESAELIVYRETDGLGAFVLNERGRGSIRWSEDGLRYRYEPIEGDPIGLVEVFANLRSAGKLDVDGSAVDADLFAATVEGQIPDAAARIHDWTLNHVENHADVLVSFKPGYFHGANIFTHIVDFAGTHGAMDRASSLGFAMATHPLPPAVRLGNLLPKEFLQGRGAAKPAGTSSPQR